MILLIFGVFILLLNNLYLYKRIYTDRAKERLLNTTIADLKRQENFYYRLFVILAHDLRSPFISLNIIVKILKESTTKIDQKLLLEKSRIDLDSTANLLDVLLQWASGQIKQNNVQRIPCTIRPMVEKCKSYFRPILESKDIKLLNLIPENISINSDPDRLELIVRNIIENAIKHSISGQYITVGTVQKNDNLCIFIKDTGTGMDHDQLIALNSRIRKRTSRKGTSDELGFGIGFLLCQEFAEELEIQLLVDSTPNKGTISILKFDRAKDLAENSIAI